MNNQNDYLLECLKELSLPALPNKKWDGQTPFTKGICFIERISGHQSYAICKFNEQTQRADVVQDFTTGTIKNIVDIYPVPDYLDTNLDQMDFEDEESRIAMEELILESEDKVMEDIDPEQKLSQWVFPHINTKEEAIAYLRKYKVKGSQALSNTDSIKAKLYVLWEDQNKKRL